MNKNKNEKKYTVSRGSLILRIVVSVYLLYTVFQLSGSIATAEGNDKIIIIIAMVVFAMVAIPLGGFSIRAITNGLYDQGDNQEEVEEDAKEVSEIMENDEDDSAKKES